MWINEIHYDNTGGDTGEFVEVIIPSSTDPSTITVTLYNGNGGVVYDSETLDNVDQGVTINGLTIYSWFIAGIQNDTEGIALDENGSLIQFISYEGTFTAVGGSADGVLSTDIGVSEPGAIGESLQLLGSGTDYTDFTWSGPHPETSGLPNSDGSGSDQALPVELVSFSATSINNAILLKWKTASELDNQGFVIERAIEKDGNYKQIDSYKHNDQLIGAGTTSEENIYNYTDYDVITGKTYWYKLVDVDISGKRTVHGPVSATVNYSSINSDNKIIPEKFQLHQNRPNPFNPSTQISFDVPELDNGPIDVSLNIYNLIGQKVATVFNKQVEAGSYTAVWNGLDDNGVILPSGIYIYQIVSGSFVQSKRMLLLK
jgi:hypothetical protein